MRFQLSTCFLFSRSSFIIGSLVCFPGFVFVCIFWVAPPAIVWEALLWFSCWDRVVHILAQAQFVHYTFSMCSIRLCGWTFGLIMFKTPRAVWEVSLCLAHLQIWIHTSDYICFTTIIVCCTALLVCSSCLFLSLFVLFWFVWQPAGFYALLHWRSGGRVDINIFLGRRLERHLIRLLLCRQPAGLYVFWHFLHVGMKLN